MPDSENSGTPDTPPEGTPQVDAPAPTPNPEPTLTPPSATVEPFQSAGGPPPEPEAPKKGKGGVVTLVVILLLLAAAGGAYYYYTQGGSLPFVGAKSTPTPSPQASKTDSDLDAAYQDANQSVGEVDTNLANVDAVLGDKQGDLSE